ncbi:hypothetical protein EJ04DRAFT_509760 [Polyplosphaeria fusca]|uniref:Uncharacterized protein n=1 Tax=Polyplosphaeria fusca TaxID=682080 RepID=A0A9P4V630_9PLEO|nr:hypothetical protein EJ04DRAFT_509760 [Polyplosphaeria fusca]
MDSSLQPWSHLGGGVTLAADGARQPASDRESSTVLSSLVGGKGKLHASASAPTQQQPL